MRLIIALLIGLISNLQAAVHTDTHTYIVSKGNNRVLVIDRKTGEEKFIKVEKAPHSMVIHQNFGYVSNKDSAIISIINLRSQKVTKKIMVGCGPMGMVIHGNFGYVVNEYSSTVSVINLKRRKETKPIAVGTHPQHMLIHRDIGYVVNRYCNTVSVIDLQTRTVTKTIAVGNSPIDMIIHGDFGYVVNRYSDTVSVIDLQTRTVTKTIAVGNNPKDMIIHGDFGYVVNLVTSDLSIIDLQTQTVTKTIEVGKYPEPMVIHGDFGYVLHYGDPSAVSVIDLKMQIAVKTIAVGKNLKPMVIHGEFGYVASLLSDTIFVIDLKAQMLLKELKGLNSDELDFSDTFIYLGIKKFRPFYPTIDSIQRMKVDNRLIEFVTINPNVFNVGQVKSRDYPVEESEFDQLPQYVLAQEIFWDLESNQPIIDPVDMLATLTTMKYPQRFLQKEAGKWLRLRLHMAFFQAVWLGKDERTQKMLTYFVQLGDPVFAKLATYTLHKLPNTPSGATNSTSK